MQMTASRLRTDVYKILDGIVATGEPVEIERKGHILRIVLDVPKAASPASKTSRLKKRPGLINGDPKDLADIDWTKEWNPDGDA
jgi:hypothetical protein